MYYIYWYQVLYVLFFLQLGMDKNRIDLGFLEKCEKPWLLINTYFPSKVGGRPSWLDVEAIPSNDRLKCTECGIQLAFLCQVRIENNIYSIFV